MTRLTRLEFDAPFISNGPYAPSNFDAPLNFDTTYAPFKFNIFAPPQNKRQRGLLSPTKTKTFEPKLNFVKSDESQILCPRGDKIFPQYKENEKKCL